jgi:hypothetical protein
LRARSETAHLLLVEGVPGAGKSTLLDALARRHVAGAGERKLRTLLHLTQAHTYGPLAPAEDAGTLTRARCLVHLERIVAGLEWLAESVRGEATAKCFALVDCLHLTACLRPGAVAWSDVAPLDARLEACNCRLVLLDACDTTVAERSVRARAGTQFLDYARRRFGPGEDDIVRHFRAERDTFRELSAASRMSSLRLTAEAAPSQLADQAFRFWRGG